MQIVKYILTAIYMIVCFCLIVMIMRQNKDDKGASGTIVGSSTNNFYEKNKSRTHEGMLKKWTVILGCTFLILSIVLGIICVIK